MPIVPHEIEWTPEKSRRVWDYYGSHAHFMPAFFGYIAGSLVAKKLFSVVRLADDARLLDFSAGRGELVGACLQHMHGRQEIHATDFSESCVDLVAKRFATTPHFKGATLIRSLPSELPGGFFDVVLATEVIEHLLDHELAAMLVECDRVLKPGGRVFFTTPNEEDYDAAKVICPDCGSVFHRWQHVRTWTVASLRTRMEQAGFTTEIAKPVTWLNWRGKLLSWLTERRIVRNGLLYVGRKAV